MTQVKAGIACLVLVVLNACNSSANAPKALDHEAPALASTSAPSSPIKVSTTVSSMDHVLSKSMAYTDARKAILGQGWEPVKNAQCKPDVVGDDYRDQCARDGNLCKPCDELPELDACSTDGHCLMKFHQSVHSLNVSVYGDAKAWSKHEPQSELSVQNWEIH